jgi:hypothetical protein
MNDTVFPFIALATVFALLVFALCLSWVRRFNLRRALGTVDASICTAGNSWQMGVCRYQDNDLEWFRLASLSMRPKHTFRRSSLELIGRRKPTESELVKVQPDAVIVELRASQIGEIRGWIYFESKSIPLLLLCFNLLHFHL